LTVNRALCYRTKSYGKIRRNLIFIYARSHYFLFKDYVASVEARKGEINMADMVEIRWHGRGGQGTVTAAKVLADACLSGGRHVQAFPEYGPERAGAPLRAYNRISQQLLRMHCPVLNPGVVAVVDATLLDAMNVAEGALDDAIFVVNTSKAPKEVREKIKAKTSQKVYTIDATKISIETIGRPMPNTPMLGAVAKASAVLGLDVLVDEVKGSFGKKFAQKIIDANLTAVKRGFEEVQQG
jgi:pyruvate ferredoxin oxidoreductase gamma subunit